MDVESAEYARIAYCTGRRVRCTKLYNIMSIILKAVLESSVSSTVGEGEGDVAA